MESDPLRPGSLVLVWSVLAKCDCLAIYLRASDLIQPRPYCVVYVFLPLTKQWAIRHRAIEGLKRVVPELEDE